MKVDTYLFGTVEVDEAKVISFPKGLVGFENSKRFMLAHEEAPVGGAASFTLQSIDEPAIAFQIIDPTTIGFNYDLVLSDDENALLQSPAAEDVAVMQVLYKAEGDGKDIVPSFRAPLLINTKARVGLQKVMEVMTRNITLSNLVNPV